MSKTTIVSVERLLKAIKHKNMYQIIDANNENDLVATAYLEENKVAISANLSLLKFNDLHHLINELLQNTQDEQSERDETKKNVQDNLPLVNAILLIKTMGAVIRNLDTENSFCEYWTNDGNENGGQYVPAAIEIEKALNER